jgi:hypothetical protein
MPSAISSLTFTVSFAELFRFQWNVSFVNKITRNLMCLLKIKLFTEVVIVGLLQRNTVKVSRLMGFKTFLILLVFSDSLSRLRDTRLA